MDKWIVAIAAGAGIIAQHFRRFKQAGDEMTNHGSVSERPDERPDSPKQPSDKKRPFRRLSGREGLNSHDSEARIEVSEDGSGAKGSNFDGEMGISLGTYEGSDGIDLVSESLTPRSRMSFRSRKVNRWAVRPLSSLESCVMAHVEMEEHMSSSFASPSRQTVRPFLVTDGSNVINRASADSYIAQKRTVVKKQPSHVHDRSGSLDATLLVSLGMSFGILYAFMENKREVEKLNRLLKQKENLIQDLEEEIEMKDSLIMQELPIDEHKSQTTDCCSAEQDNQESFSKIEAELEAELEMLELSMSSSKLERKISNLAEIDPDFEPGVAEGELRAEMLRDTNEEDETTHSANYTVSPRELSLRLHELLQSQLRERIRELEAQIEVQNHKSWKDFSSSDAGGENHVDEPVVLNLSGEALDAYNEACNEFAKFDESDEEFDNGTPRNGGYRGVDEVDFDDDDDNDDEMEKLLIKHIVEKARQGSPAVLNAQRALLSE